MINHIDSSLIFSISSRFADDTNIYRKVNDEDDASLLQKDLVGCFYCLRYGKCLAKFIILVQKSYDKIMDKTTLSNGTLETDLGIVIAGDLKPFSQCAAAAIELMPCLG